MEAVLVGFCSTRLELHAWADIKRLRGQCVFRVVVYITGGLDGHGVGRKRLERL